MQGRRCPVGVTVASGLKPPNSSPEGRQVQSAPAAWGCVGGESRAAWISPAPKSSSFQFLLLLKIQKPPAMDRRMGKQGNQKLMEMLAHSPARWRATGSVSRCMGSPWG